MALPGFVRGQGVGERDEKRAGAAAVRLAIGYGGGREGGKKAREWARGARGRCLARVSPAGEFRYSFYEDGCRCRSWPMSGGQAREELQAEGVWLSERKERCVCACG